MKLLLFQFRAFSSSFSSMKSKYSQEELKKRLTPLQYQVTQQCGTEPPFKNEYHKTIDKGIYNCIVCGDLLFSSESKFNSGCGWPAFWSGADPAKIRELKDTSHGMTRIEVRCANCDAHLGHKFDDGPIQHGGVRYCINSASIKFNT